LKRLASNGGKAAVICDVNPCSAAGAAEARSTSLENALFFLRLYTRVIFTLNSQRTLSEEADVGGCAKHHERRKGESQEEEEGE